MEEACRAVTAFRKTLKPHVHWLSAVEAEMVEELDKADTKPPFVDCKQQCRGCKKDA
jgi:hypothetical protein